MLEVKHVVWFFQEQHILEIHEGLCHQWDTCRALTMDELRGDVAMNYLLGGNVTICSQLGGGRGDE